VTTTSTAGWTCKSTCLARNKNNQLAIGMRVKVIARGMAQSDEVHSGGSYLSQNELSFTFRVEHPRQKSIASKFATLRKTETPSRIFPSTSSIPSWRGPASFRPEGFYPNPVASPKSRSKPRNGWPNWPAGRPWRPTSLAMNRAHLLFFPKSKISTEGPFALKKRLLHFLFAATPPHVSLAGGPTRGFEPP